jgi:hypothetical protein
MQKEMSILANDRLRILSYRKVASSRQVYYSILDHFVQRSQYISIKILLHKQFENVKMCY